MEVKKDGGRFSASPPCTRRSEAENRRWGLYHLLEKFLFRPAKRTNPIIGKIVKGCAGLDAVFNISFRRIVHIPAGAFIFIHGLLLIVDIDPSPQPGRGRYWEPTVPRRKPAPSHGTPGIHPAVRFHRYSRIRSKHNNPPLRVDPDCRGLSGISRHALFRLRWHR